MDTRIRIKTMDTFLWTIVCINLTALVATITGTFYQRTVVHSNGEKEILLFVCVAKHLFIVFNSLIYVYIYMYDVEWMMFLLWRQSGHHQQQQHMGRGGTKNNHHKMQPNEPFNDADCGEAVSVYLWKINFQNRILNWFVNRKFECIVHSWIYKL